MQTKTFWDACSDLSAALFKTYAAIHKLCDNEIGYCFAKNKIIAEKINKHEVSVSRDISDLIEKGHLFSIEIKRGYVVVERRIYTTEQALLFQEDKENLENLIVTSYIEEDGIKLFTNERYDKGIKRNTVNKIVNGDNTINKNANGTVNKIVNGTVNKNAKVNYSNINLSNITTTSSSEDIKILLEQHGISASTKINILDLVKENNITKERVGAVLKRAVMKKWAEGAIYTALRDEWNLEDETIQEKREISKKAQFSYEKSMKEIEVQNIEKDRVKEEWNKKDYLKKIFEQFSPALQESIKSRAFEIAKEKYGSIAAKTMANTIVLYDLIQEELEKVG